jgi:hypothetical protein
VQGSLAAKDPAGGEIVDDHAQGACGGGVEFYEDVRETESLPETGRLGRLGYRRRPEDAYRVLHNSLHFSFSKTFVWSCLLWLSVTPLLSAVQRIRADTADAAE